MVRLYELGRRTRRIAAGSTCVCRPQKRAAEPGAHRVTPLTNVGSRRAAVSDFCCHSRGALGQTLLPVRPISLQIGRGRRRWSFCGRREQKTGTVSAAGDLSRRDPGIDGELIPFRELFANLPRASNRAAPPCDGTHFARWSSLWRPRPDQQGARSRECCVHDLATGTAGVAVRIRGGFMFYASDSRYHHVDQHTFSNLRVLRATLASSAANRDSVQSRHAIRNLERAAALLDVPS